MARVLKGSQSFTCTVLHAFIRKRNEPYLTYTHTLYIIHYCMLRTSDDSMLTNERLEKRSEERNVESSVTYQHIPLEKNGGGSASQSWMEPNALWPIQIHTCTSLGRATHKSSRIGVLRIDHMEWGDPSS